MIGGGPNLIGSRRSLPISLSVIHLPHAEVDMSISEPPLVGVIMGSRSDWATLRAAAEILTQFGVTHECEVVSAHRTPDRMHEYAKAAEGRGLKVIIAGAGGAAHLPGMVASQTVLPVLGVPVQSKALNGLDSLLSIVQMPGGVPVGTLAIGEAGAKNAALLAIRMLAGERPDLRKKLHDYHAGLTQDVLKDAAL
jgi:5-(carboxyamino)imidazole ribonucleotide mutase